jgi:hypothetical protein
MPQGIRQDTVFQLSEPERKVRVQLVAKVDNAEFNKTRADLKGLQSHLFFCFFFFGGGTGSCLAMSSRLALDS